MKRISIMLSCVLGASLAIAQPGIKENGIFKKNPAGHKQSARQATHKLLSRQMANSDQAKTTASYERMIGFSDYAVTTQQGPLVIVDSGALSYSGMRGSGYDFNSMSIGNYDPVFGAIMPGNGLLFKSDDLKIYPDNGSSTIVEYTFTYDNNDNVVEAYIVDNYMNGPDERLLTTYNGQDPIYTENLRHNGSSWDTIYRRYFHYDTNNLLVEDSVMENINNVWTINQKYQYGYDGNNNIDYLKYYGLDGNNVFNPIWEDHYSYDGNDRMQAAMYYMYDTVADVMVLDSRDTFEYTSNLSFFTRNTYYGWDTTNSVWEPIVLFDKHLNTQMLPDTLTISIWNSNAWDPVQLDAYTYTSYGNVLHDTAWGFTNQSIDEDPGYVGHFYYELYYDLGVKNTSVQPVVKVYPNPTSDVLTVSCNDAKGLRLEIVNALGQTVKKAQSASTAKLSIGDLTPGVYWLTVTDASGSKLHQQTIVKQ